MRIATSGATLVATLLLPVAAVHAVRQEPAEQIAQQSAAYAKLPACTLAADGRSLAVEPCRTAPAQRPMPRRPVPAQGEARIGIPDTRPQAPSLMLPSATLNSPYPAAPRPPVPPAVNPSAGNGSAVPAPGAYAVPPPGATRPSPAACVGTGCRDATGTQYRGGAVLTSPTGRPCTNTGGFVSCM
ncbi:hypothetical protein IP91_02615 [Pseudoduganella lurida]|uniref:DUF3761 domain-containing protein n=1 Tax=Pseudoduganella lurida TaxID=1036180 RepID=A0A562R801_9BURK|nr:hypothetical protein [Pseudoduganella lurida]TWI65208.1 hypothetical protein IP91_02615 [Pseudoduganella lurida]